MFGQKHAVAMHLALWYVVLVCHQYNVLKNNIGSVYVGIFGKFGPVGFLVVCKCSSVVMQSVVVLMMGRWSDDSACSVVHDVRLYSVFGLR